MIFSRAPFRITLAGGGTDLPAFYKKHGATFLSCAIDKYIYVGFRKRTFEKEARVQYLDCENVVNVSLLKHTRARACLESFGYSEGVEVISSADLSAKSGMGSSGAYIVALLACLNHHKGLKISPEEIAAEACRIEMDVLREPVGKQDQYISSLGSITQFHIDKFGTVSSSQLNLADDLIAELEKNCMIFYTGVQRDASSVLKSQQQTIQKDDSSMLAIQEIGIETITAIKTGNLDKFGRLMHEHWLEKKKLSKDVTINKFDLIYKALVESEKILGGKIIGAGGGGFLMVYVPSNHKKIEDEMNLLGFPKLNWKVSHTGVSIGNWF